MGPLRVEVAQGATLYCSLARELACIAFLPWGYRNIYTVQVLGYFSAARNFFLVEMNVCMHPESD